MVSWRNYEIKKSFAAHCSDRGTFFSYGSECKVKMRVKWIGILLLVLNLFMIPLYITAGVIGHTLAFIITAVCVVIILQTAGRTIKTILIK